MKYKSILSAALAAVMLAGCGADSTASAAIASPAAEDNVVSSAVPEETTQPSAEQVTITNPVDLNILDEHPDMSGYQWLEDDNPPFVEISLKESIRMFTEKGTGILYYGRPGCQWCQRAVPVLDAAAKNLGVTIYYINVEKPIAPTTEESKQLYDELCGYLSSIFEKDPETGEPEFQIPEVVAVKDGEIMGHHLSLVDDFTLVDENTQMDDAQKEELAAIYRQLILSVADE